MAGYWYQWSEGHEGRFAVGVAWGEEEGFVATASGITASEGIRYGINEIEDSPWGDMSDYGRHLSRHELLELVSLRTKFFELVDALAAKEPNLSRRIKERYALL